MARCHTRHRHWPIFSPSLFSGEVDCPFSEHLTRIIQRFWKTIWNCFNFLGRRQLCSWVSFVSSLCTWPQVQVVLPDAKQTCMTKVTRKRATRSWYLLRTLFGFLPFLLFSISPRALWCVPRALCASASVHRLMCSAHHMIWSRCFCNRLRLAWSWPTPRPLKCCVLPRFYSPVCTSDLSDSTSRSDSISAPNCICPIQFEIG